MMKKLFSILLVQVLAVASCSKPRSWVELHNDAVKDGYAKLPDAASFAARHQAVSFIENINMESLPKKWKMVAVVDGKYEVIYEIPITYDDRSSKVIGQEGEDVMVINEIEAIVTDGSGVTRTSFGGFQEEIRGERLRALKAANWDLRAVGAPLPVAPLPNIDVYWSRWERLYPEQAGKGRK